MQHESSSALSVWRAGSLVFGDKWILKHGEVPTGEWNNVLLAFDETQIAKGIQRMTKDAEHKIKIGDDAWPPTAFEFACYCKTANSHYFHSPALPPPAKVSTPEYALERLAEIKQILKPAPAELPDETFPRDPSTEVKL